MLDVTGIPAKQGGYCHLIGKDGNLEITADQVAESIVPLVMNWFVKSANVYQEHLPKWEIN